SEGGSYNIEVSLNQFNNWFLRSVGLHDEQTQSSLRALHPEFLPRHDTAFAEICSMVMATMKNCNGTETGELWDPARFTKNHIEWGVEGEEAQYLDWRRIVLAQNGDGETNAMFNLQGTSSRPGSHEATWLRD
nr:hypothetical protein [Tanacetum cinerariifolium]